MKENKTKSVAAKSLKAGGYSVAITAVLLAALIFVNLIVASIPAEYTKLDTSAKQFYTLDKQTEQIVDSVNEKITVYYIAQSGNELDMLKNLLERYTSRNSNIKVKTVDPAVSPNFVAQYTDEALADNSLIVVSDKRVKVVPYGEIVYTSYANITQEEYYNYIYYGVMPQGETIFAGENAITAAIDYVVATDIPKIYFLKGHGEITLSETYLKYITDENFEYDQLGVASAEGGSDTVGDLTGGLDNVEFRIPEDADCIVINVPKSDISTAELDALITFARGGGTVIVSANYNAKTLTNLTALASALGLDICGGLVIEGTQNYYMQQRYYLLPEAQTHEITDPIIEGGKYVLAANSHAMKKAETLPEDVRSVTPLFLTSNQAIAKVDPAATKTVYEEGDLQGQFVSAAAIEIGEGKAVWFATPYIADDTADQMVSGGNSDAFLNSIGWCCEKTSSVSVRTISMSVAPLTVTEQAANGWLIVLCVVIPLAFAGAGFLIWFRRRSK